MSVKKSVLEQFESKKLESYLDPKSRYVSDAVIYAVEILQKRGRYFSQEELLSINELIKEREKQENLKEEGDFGVDRNLTNDKSAVKLYSRNLLWSFGILFSVVFASVLLAINFHKLNLKKPMILTLLFGITYTVLQIVFWEPISGIFRSMGMNLHRHFCCLQLE